MGEDHLPLPGTCVKLAKPKDRNFLFFSAVALRSFPQPATLDSRIPPPPRNLAQFNFLHNLISDKICAVLYNLGDHSVPLLDIKIDTRKKLFERKAKCTREKEHMMKEEHKGKRTFKMSDKPTALCRR